MKIVTLEEFCKMPVGTVFAVYKPYFIGECNIKTGEPFEMNGSIGFNGAIPLSPWFVSDDPADWADDVGEYPVEFCSTDISSADYEQDELIAVLEKQEVKELIEYLVNALRLGYSEGEV